MNGNLYVAIRLSISAFLGKGKATGDLPLHLRISEISEGFKGDPRR